MNHTLKRWLLVLVIGVPLGILTGLLSMVVFLVAYYRNLRNTDLRAQAINDAIRLGKVLVETNVHNN